MRENGRVVISMLLLVSFRSVVVAAKAIVLNLLSVGAAYGRWLEWLPRVEHETEAHPGEPVPAV